MEKRKIGVEEAVNEEIRLLIRGISDDKKQLLKIVGEAINGLNELQSQLMTHKNTHVYKVRTDLDGTPMIIDADRLERYSRMMNVKVDKLELLYGVQSAINGELEV